MLPITIKPTDKLIKGYYEALGQFESLHASHEGAVRKAFQDMLSGYSRKLEWTLVPEYPIHPRKGQRIIVDGAVIDFWKQRRGFWEAKDEHDDLEREIKSKIEKGYPTKNIIFQAPERAILYQHGVRQGLNDDIRNSKNLVDLLTEFYGYREPDHEEWDAAVSDFKDRIPELADTARKLIEKERKTTKAFRETFEAFYDLCRQAINPNLSDKAVEEMLIQHLLTERIFRRVFHNEEFRSRNVIACEIEKVITSMTSRHFSRDQFLSELDRFYKAIERSADDKEDYTEKQAFLNTVYERFFQGYSPKEADTHGIVYTPQPIVDFMVRSVDDILKKEFGRSLADKGVHILDPFVGTGNFITRVMRQIVETKKSALPHKYEHELHCNEVMLLPYYIASMNIEHEYLEQVGEYKPFDGICLVDTFELAEPEQASLGFMNEENTARVKRQKEAPIFVIIGNPPYNARQLDENDNNKNRKYGVIDNRVAETYGKLSNATNTQALSDPYVKAIRWASDRIGDEGVVTFITNNGFIDGIAFDGMHFGTQSHILQHLSP
jgi:predicted helicase